MPTTLPTAATDFTDRDFESVRQRLESLARSVFPNWSDWSEANFGVLLCEMMCWVLDVLEYYQGRQFREGRLCTAELRENVLALTRMLGYTMRPAAAASADVTFALPRATAVAVTLPAGLVVRTPEVTNSVRFRLLAETQIAAGETSVQGAVENADVLTRQYSSTGLADQEIVLDRAPYVDGSVEVTADNGAYTAVDTLFESEPTDRHVAVRVDASEKAHLRFGNGVTGAIPTGTITVLWKTGGGRGGNVDAGRISIIESAVYDQNGNPVSLSVSNAEPASGGRNRESVASAKQRAPAALRTLTRTVTREDFETNALRVAGVARALMVTRNEWAAVDENAGTLYVVPAGGGTPSSALLDDVEEMVEDTYPHTLTFDLLVAPAQYKTVDVEALVYFRAGYNKTNVAAAIRANLAAFFAPESDDGTPNTGIDFGLGYSGADDEEPAIPWADVFNVIRDTEGVRKIDDGPSGLLLNGERRDVALAIIEFPCLGDITLRDGQSGEEL